MNYKIVYSSITGNTKLLAEAIERILEPLECAYSGVIDGDVNHDADILFVGFCVHEGSCTDEVRAYLARLENERVALFGTAGFGGSKSYCETILEKVQAYMPKSNSVIGGFMCQGKMTENVLERYSRMLTEKPEDAEISGMINNYENALSHPDEDDLHEVQLFAKQIFGY